MSRYQHIESYPSEGQGNTSGKTKWCKGKQGTKRPPGSEVSTIYVVSLHLRLLSNQAVDVTALGRWWYRAAKSSPATTGSHGMRNRDVRTTVLRRDEVNLIKETVRLRVAVAPGSGAGRGLGEGQGNLCGSFKPLLWVEFCKICWISNPSNLSMGQYLSIGSTADVISKLRWGHTRVTRVLVRGGETQRPREDTASGRRRIGGTQLQAKDCQRLRGAGGGEEGPLPCGC